MVRYTDNTLMPFGKHKGKAMINVPAPYLIYLYENGLNHEGVRSYINDNLEALRVEAERAKKFKRELKR